MSTETLTAPKRTKKRNQVTKTTIAGFRKNLQKLVGLLADEDQNRSVEQYLSEKNGSYVLATYIDGTYVSVQVHTEEEDEQ